MRTGFVSFERREPKTSIEQAGDSGFDYVELMMDGKAHREEIERDPDDFTAALERASVDLLVHFPYPMLIGSPHRHQREGAIRELKRCIEAAASIGAEKGVVHPDSYGWPRVWEQAEVKSILSRSVAELDDFATEQGLEICVENLFGNRGALDVNQFDTLFSETDVSMTFDTGHAAIAGMDESEMAEFLSAHRDRVSHVHINDTRHFDHGYQGADEHLPIGYGSIDFERALEPLIAGDWDVTLSIELDTTDYEYLETSKRRVDRIIG